jgi:2-dehydro-3-deoxyphosphogluconate aldolase/(4S)-4-hydroxy-2-oxoglutarate aldolase
MLDREKIIADIEKNKIVVIMRGFTKEELLKSVEAMAQGGIGLVEVTFDQSGKVPNERTADDIKMLSETFRGRVRIGAGTVMTKKQVELAYEAGAEFIISPDCYKEVIERTRELSMVSMPGAFTPTECANAVRWGADFVKLFPNSEFKPSYLKALMAPLSHVKFLAVGGVTAENLKEYLDIGVSGVGVATAIANKTFISAGEYDKVTEAALKFTSQL